MYGTDDYYESVPTGVADFDSIINGGLPDGSVVLLVGDVGGGQREFCYTSACKLSMVLDDPERKGNILGDMCREARVPEKVCYISLSRTQEDIMREIRASFHGDFHKALMRHMVFKDLSGTYFRNSIIPSSWSGSQDLFTKDRTKGDLLSDLVDFLDNNAKSSLVIIDSLTHLAETGMVPMKDLVATLRGLQRIAKSWGGIVYLLLTRGILDPKEEQMIIDSVDGVIVFQWSKTKFNSRRARYMYVEKFMSILPHLDEKNIARFSTMVTANQGLVVINTEKIA